MRAGRVCHCLVAVVHGMDLDLSEHPERSGNVRQTLFNYSLVELVHVCRLDELASVLLKRGQTVSDANGEEANASERVWHNG